MPPSDRDQIDPRDIHPAGLGGLPAQFNGRGPKTGKVIVLTNELAMSIVSRPVSVPDLHATIHAALGLD